ncbi:hypothetical protein SEUCBS140593_007925 [Sporothrix eucalyptigena]|uniref:Vacuolar protein sorting-associated protein 54 C-terminal domain-containing protein n=1 Tax=Sporothrix eucalyptigena TaxID=1812306 RepID=A0ABP0CH71_9PEZI
MSTSAGADSMTSGAVFELSPNAISTLLEPASTSTLSLHVPTAWDIPPVPLTNIELVDDAEFQLYNQGVGAILLAHLQQLQQFSSNDEGHHKDPSSLSTIPGVYFDEGFRLQNPRTFDVVSEQSQVVDTHRGRANNSSVMRKQLSTNAILQEKLSWYLDTVEVYLIDSIAQSSTAFFSALVSLQDLYADVEEALATIKVLRERFSLKSSVVEEHLELVRKRHVLNNLHQMSDGVFQMECIVANARRAKLLVEHGRLGAALDEIEATEQLMAGEAGGHSVMPKGIQLYDLRQMAALRDVVADLVTLRAHISKAYEKTVCELLINDLRQRVESASLRDAIMQWEARSQRAKGNTVDLPNSPSYMGATSDLEETLSPYVCDLYRSKALLATVRLYRQQALQEIRRAMLRALLGSADDYEPGTREEHFRKDEENLTMPMEKIRLIDDVGFKKLLSTVFVGVVEILRRLQTQASVFFKIASNTNGTEEESAKMQLDMHFAFDLVPLLKSFTVPRSTLACLEGISRFLRLVSNIPAMTSGIAQSLASYLHTFNTRCRQLILGRGAQHSAVLKTITTAHLALVARGVAFIAALLPYMREFVQCRLSRNQATFSRSVNLDFDKVEKGFKDHQTDVYEALVETMVARGRSLSDKARQVDWDNETPENARVCMADLTRDTTKLYKTLVKYFPPREIDRVMGPVFASYKEHLSLAFKAACPHTENGKACMTRDVDYLVSKLGNMQSFGDLGTHLKTIVGAHNVTVLSGLATEEN